MSDVSSVNASALSSVHHRHARALEQKMFQKIDANGDNSISQAELESAVTGAGGTTQGADALFAQLDPNTTGSVSSSQFVSGFQALSFSAANGQQLIDAQAQATGGTAPQDPFTQFTAQVFGKLDADGDGALTKSELEKAVTAAGGSTASADALYAQLDPNNTSSVSQAQFSANFPKPGQASASATGSGDSAQAALGALFQSMNPLTQVAQDLFSQLDADGDGTLTKTELEQAVTAKGGTAAQADALYAKLDPNNTGAVTEQQFTQYAVANDRPHHMHHGHGGSGKGNDLLAAGSTNEDTDTGTTADAAASSGSGDTAQDAASALLNAIQQAEQQTAGNASGSTSQVGGVTSTTAGPSTGTSTTSAAAGNSAAAAVDALEAAIKQLMTGTSTQGASTLANFDPSLYQSMFGASFSSSSMSALLDAQSGLYPATG